jgi:predicted AlkP superfamily phosphohydrolase/phosphomutase
VFLIGWDGATFDLIRPWVAQGKLPTIARLMQSGAHGPLLSTMPYWTFPAWTSFMTGTNPGKHGIFDFTRRRAGRYDLEFVNGGTRRAPTFWRILSQAGRRVISISIPCTYPPEPVNGVMISGMDAPGMGARGGVQDAHGMYPPGLCEELERNLGGHPTGGYIAVEINRGRPHRALELILETIRRKAATARYLMSTRPWECCMILFGESDGAGHQFWKYCDRESPLYQGEPEGLGDSILRVYQELDRQTGELLEHLPPSTTVMMMSDHGFGGVGDWVLYPNCWLSERGFLEMRGRSAHWRSRTLDRLKLRAVATLPAGVKRALIRLVPRRLGSLESRVRHSFIDWTSTEAYFDENPYFPMVWVNLRGRQPRGIVAPGPHYEDVRDRLIRDLEAWRHPETGEPIVEKAYRREEVYAGPCLEEAPDVIPDWALQHGYSYTFKVSSKSRDRAWIEHVDPYEPQMMDYFMNKSGTHRPHGIFVAQGDPIRPGAAVEGARIIDLAPTILHLLGVAVPAHMDGVVLRQIFTDRYACGAVARSASHQDDLAAAPAGNGYSAEEERVIAERLRALGYVD